MARTAPVLRFFRRGVGRAERGLGTGGSARAPSSASTPTPRTSRLVRSWPRTPPATSSSSGSSEIRTARATAFSASATPAPAPRSAPSSSSTPTPRASQDFPSIASDTAGNFVVVWTELRAGRVGRGRFRPALRQLRRPARPRVPRQHLHHGLPRLSVRGLGRRRQLRRRLAELRQDGAEEGVFGQRYASSGAPLGPEFRVNTYTTNCSGTSGRDFGCLRQLRRRLGQCPAGRVVPGRLRPALRHLRRPPRPRVPRQHLHHQPSEAPDVALDASGSFVVAWSSYGQDGSIYGVFGQRYDSSGAPLGPEFQVNTYTTGTQRDPSVAVGHGRQLRRRLAERTRTAGTMVSSASATPAPAPRSALSSASTPSPRTPKTFRP